MKKLSVLITMGLAGLSFNVCSQTFSTSYDANDLDRIGRFSVYFGTNAGLNSTGEFNTFAGFTTGASNTTGTNNVFTGAFAGFSNTTGNDNIFSGRSAGFFNTSGTANVFTGFEAGYSNTIGFSNIFTGNLAGRNNTTGNFNIFTGSQAGLNNTVGSHNIFTGFRAGPNNTTGSENIIMGQDSGGENTTGSTNVFIGRAAGGLNTSGSNNIAIGNRAGFRSGFNDVGGENNVFIGHYAGWTERGNSKLYIDDTAEFDENDADTPLIYGDFETNQLVFHGQVSTGIGNTNFPTDLGGEDISHYTLFVQGGLLTEQLRVNNTWADYVFDDTYELKSLSEVEVFIKENGHLPNVPSAKQVEASGINVGEITKIQQEKIEELTLYLIEISKQIKAIKQENVELKETLVKLQK